MAPCIDGPKYLLQGKRRTGGSALAQAYGQIGDDCPDVDGEMLKGLFNTMMRMHDKQYLSAGHDISDGGIATTLLEMAFAGNCGIEVGGSPSDNTMVQK